MKYRQSVIVKNVTLQKANETFNDIKFLKYLIALQPVKIINWDGTYDGAEAHMKFWFFGWKDFKVTHGENRSEKNLFSFKDIGSVLPFGLSKWEHTHIVLKKENNVEIVDELNFKGPNSLIMFFVAPVLIFPIFLRRVLSVSYTHLTLPTNSRV